MDLLFSDSFYSAVQTGINGIYNNDLNSIIAAIDFIDTQISNSNFVLEDPYLSQNDQLTVINSRLRELYFQYRLLFDVYRTYLLQTGTNVSYVTWLSTRNNASPFNNQTPADYINRQQPIWYSANDTDGDGTIDEVIPEPNGTGRTHTWTSSPSQSANLYRTLRGAIDPGNSASSGRLVPKIKKDRARKSKLVRQSEDGYYWDEWDYDPNPGDPGFGGAGGGIKDSFGDNTWNPGGGNLGGGTGDINLGGGRPTEDAIRRQRLLEEYNRTRGRNLSAFGSRTNLNLSNVGTMGTSLRTGISMVDIPIIPLGGSPGTPLSNAINFTPMMAPMGAPGAYGGASGADGAPISSTSATPGMLLSLGGINPSVPPGSPMGAMGAAGAGLANVVLNAGTCQPDYSFKISQVTNNQTKRFYGFNIKSTPQLKITMVAACPGQIASELFTLTFDASTHYTFGPNATGGISIVGTENSQSRSIGKIKYAYYYDFLDIIRKIYEQIIQLKINATDTIWQNIEAQLTAFESQQQGAKLPFVDRNTGILSQGQRLLRRPQFYDVSKTPRTGFVTNLPSVVQNDIVPPDYSWELDARTAVGMHAIENMVYMGTIDYGALTFQDIITSTTVDQSYQYNNRLDISITSLVSSRITGEVENPTETGNGTTPLTPTVIDDVNGEIIQDGGSVITSTKISGRYNTAPYTNLSWEFPISTVADCLSPILRTGNGNVPQWTIRTDDQFGVTQYVYPQQLTSQNLLDLSSVNATDGSITGEIVNRIRNNTVSVQELQTNYGISLQVTRFDANLTAIPSSPCLSGIRNYSNWTVKRTKRIPIKIFCLDGKEIDYRTNGSNIQNWLIAQLKSNSSYGARQLPDGTLLKMSNGYFYVEGEQTVSLVGTGLGELVQYGSVVVNTSNPGCTPVKTVESSWVVDLDNPCGCDEVEVLTHYLTYPEITYKNPSDPNPIIFPSRRILDPEYPAPAPETKAASYGLSVGQSLTDNRRQKPDCFEGNGIGRLHHPFLYGTDVLPGMRKKSIKGLFNLSQSLECYHTSSLQSAASKEYYYEVTDCDNCERTVYFAVAYGNWKGSGSISSGYEKDDSPTRAIYSQYRLLTLDPHEKNFTFYDGGSSNTPDDIYVINYYRNGLSDKLDIGNFEINIAELSGSGIVNSVHTGSNVKISGSNPKILTLIDNSAIFDDENVCANDDPNYYYDIVSGSLADGIHSSGEGTLQTNEDLTTYGKVYPNLGVIVLDGHKLNVSASFNSVSSSNANGDNSFKLFTAISGAAVVDKPMRARNVKFKTTNHYFVRIPSGEANYSTNPTYVFDSGDNKGKIKNACFIDNPMTYITTVGLYNTKKELIAVAKLSKPIKKSKENDVLIKIRLNW
jgi:hypothetical protein